MKGIIVAIGDYPDCLCQWQILTQAKTLLKQKSAVNGGIYWVYDDFVKEFIPHYAELSDVDWADMPHDKYLKDGGHYRRRRYSSFIFKDNILHGGMERWFEPVLNTTISKTAWSLVLFDTLVVTLSENYFQNAVVPTP